MIRGLSVVAVALALSCGGSRPATRVPIAATPPTFRLPGDVAPARYVLDLTLDPTAATLDLIATGVIDIRDGREAVLAILQGRRTRDMGYAWVVGGLCEREKREDAAAFFGPRAKRRDGAELALTNALEKVDRCVEKWARDRPHA
jgi:hypothetical protein